MANINLMRSLPLPQIHYTKGTAFFQAYLKQNSGPSHKISSYLHLQKVPKTAFIKENLCKERLYLYEISICVRFDTDIRGKTQLFHVLGKFMRRA